MGHGTLDLGAVSLSPILYTEITFKFFKKSNKNHFKLNSTFPTPNTKIESFPSAFHFGEWCHHWPSYLNKQPLFLTPYNQTVSKFILFWKWLLNLSFSHSLHNQHPGPHHHLFSSDPSMPSRTALLLAPQSLPPQELARDFQHVSQIMSCLHKILEASSHP